MFPSRTFFFFSKYQLISGLLELFLIKGPLPRVYFVGSRVIYVFLFTCLGYRLVQVWPLRDAMER